jgi:guanylate kinase
MNDGRFFIISGPSGAGKGLVVDELFRQGFDGVLVVTTTSRPPIGSETEGQPYHFVSAKAFQEKIRSGAMMEWREIFGDYYGATKKEIDRVRATGKTVLWKVDPKGARTIQELMPDAVTIFIVPSSFDLLEEKLRVSEHHVDQRVNEKLKNARREMAHLLDWDAVIVLEHDLLDDAVRQVREVIRTYQ